MLSHCSHGCEKTPYKKRRGRAGKECHEGVLSSHSFAHLAWCTLKSFLDFSPPFRTPFSKTSRPVCLSYITYSGGVPLGERWLQSFSCIYSAPSFSTPKVNSWHTTWIIQTWTMRLFLQKLSYSWNKNALLALSPYGERAPIATGSLRGRGAADLDRARVACPT